MSTSTPETIVVPCGKCGCLGNCSCGHEPLDEERGCALGPSEICHCCRIKRNIRDASATAKTVRDLPPINVEKLRAILHRSNTELTDRRGAGSVQ
jgi:hypothetical protein